MTKKDLELIVKIIRSLDLRTPSCPNTDHHMRTVARAFAKALHWHNQSSDELRFIEACLDEATPEEFTAASLADLDRMMEEV